MTLWVVILNEVKDLLWVVILNGTHVILNEVKDLLNDYIYNFADKFGIIRL